MEMQQAKPYVSMFAFIEREEGRKKAKKGAKMKPFRLLLRLLELHRFG
ncbi:MAG: hypothetical protein R3E79_37985 [Caldilineaceae bacterium]